MIFPHHENEIAQSEAALGKEFARFWVHNGFVQIDSEKMTKSLGNFKTIRDILEQRQPETLRFFLLGKHYRSPIDFSFDGMDDAERGLKRVYECLAEAERARARAAWKPGSLPDEVTREFDDLNRAFFEAMDDDFNTAAALGHVFGIVRLVNRVLEDKPLKNCQGAAELLENSPARGLTGAPRWACSALVPRFFCGNCAIPAPGVSGWIRPGGKPAGRAFRGSRRQGFHSSPTRPGCSERLGRAGTGYPGGTVWDIS